MALKIFSEQIHLAIFAGFYNAVFDHIFIINYSAYQRRCGIMRGIMLCYRIGTIICITVFAAVFTAVVSAYVNTFYTAAAFPLVFIRLKIKLLT